MVEWFQSWFDTKYYHILYGHRDEVEADQFVREISNKLQITPDALILDLACGTGRHVETLSRIAGNVIGIDLSKNSILEARQRNLPNAEFYVHDMRHTFWMNYFDGIVSFFTSFGYFKYHQENVKVLENVKHGLRRGGFFLLDYLNASVVKENLILEEKIQRGDIQFHITRTISQNFIEKTISFHADGRDWNFQERVALYESEALIDMLTHCGFGSFQLFGNHALSIFDKKHASRCIIHCIKQ